MKGSFSGDETMPHEDIVVILSSICGNERRGCDPASASGRMVSTLVG